MSDRKLLSDKLQAKGRTPPTPLQGNQLNCALLLHRE